ncbi:Sec-independent protein translocase protein TatB [Kiloniella sp. b19]|uniref:Sec-independent protein translocase protein TatB n=1 Tax=Kiloniella sp. GXU_MW_B19 TaxID=3141326 RepID=UPI0031E2085A
MFDIGWSEMMVIAVLVLLIMGPKELPQTLRTITAFVRKGKELAGEFRSGVDELVREADLDDARDMMNKANPHSIRESIESVVDPEQSLKKSAMELNEAANRSDGPVPGFSSSTEQGETTPETPETDVIEPTDAKTVAETTPAQNASADNAGQKA